jgi:hypothetical protein
MKRSIAWHEDCLANQYRYAQRTNAEGVRLIAKAAEGYESAHEYKKQIERAKRLGKDGFDAEKFKAEG